MDNSDWATFLLLLALLLVSEIKSSIVSKSDIIDVSANSSFELQSSLKILSRNERSKNRFYNPTPGETYPNIVEVAIGDDFNITCTMDLLAFPGKTSRDLYFVNGHTDQRLSMENLYIINDTAVVYVVRNATEQQEIYRCKCGSYAIMESKVYVGYPPRPIDELLCRSYDLEYMVCNFTKPPNPILTQYNVSFYTDSMEEYSYKPECNFDGHTLVVCNISLANNYRPRVEIYNYVINGRNALSEMKPQNFSIENWDVMIPSRPGTDYFIETLTDRQLEIRWRMPKWEEYRTRGLQWETIIRVENSTDLTGLFVPERVHGYLRLVCDNLPFANWQYELKLRVRVDSSANNNVNNWSEPFFLPFKTAERIPDRAPDVAKGGFYIDSMETKVTIYWEQLFPYEYNGDNFNYTISGRASNEVETFTIKPLLQDLNLATFDWDKRFRYDFVIRSSNRLGSSINGSRLSISPMKDYAIKEFTPKAIHNVYHAGNRTYILSWSHPLNTKDLLNYTVYWCFPKRALPNECKGPMNFLQLPGNQLSYTTVPQNALQEHTLNLAVSADYKDFNSGLHWTDCTMDLNSDLVKMDPDVMANSANSLLVQWSVDRICTSILEGFRLVYCEVYNNITSNNNAISKIETNYDNLYIISENECIKDTIQIKNLTKDLKKYEINNLKPYTMYSVSMLMYSGLKKGKISDAQILRTMEAAPMAPRQLQVTNITNSTATISWLPPAQSNGIIRQYIITLNNDRVTVNADTFWYGFNELESFTSYKVYVVAQGIELSPPSNDIHFTTLIGVPSPPGHAISSSGTNNLIQWTKPLQTRGRIDFYEVAITQMRYDELLRQRISVILDGVTSCTFKPPPCIGPEYKTIVEVRAVNVAPDMDIDLFSSTIPTEFLHDDRFNNLLEHEDPNNYNGNEDLICFVPKPISLTQTKSRKSKPYKYRLYKSAWSSTETYACSTSRISRVSLIALTIVSLLLGIMFVLYMAGKKYNKMANINCTLPAGLDSYFNKDAVGSAFSAATSINEKMHPRSERILMQNDADDGRIDHWFKINRLPGTIPYNLRNEQDHLLDSIGHDSGYGRFESSNHNNLSLENLSLSKRAEITEESDGYYQFPKKNKKLFQNNMELSKDQNNYEYEQNLNQNTSGYISVDTLNLPENQLTTLQLKREDPIMNEYVSVNGLEDDLNKITTQSINLVNDKEDQYTNENRVTAQTSISGYVTQYDLNVFAAAQQQEQIAP